MAELPYLDDHGDLHVTATMAHELRLAAGDSGGVERFEKILGVRFYREEVEPRLRNRARLSAMNPTLFGMQIYIEPEPAADHG